MTGHQVIEVLHLPLEFFLLSRYHSQALLTLAKDLICLILGQGRGSYINLLL